MRATRRSDTTAASQVMAVEGGKGAGRRKACNQGTKVQVQAGPGPAADTGGGCGSCCLTALPCMPQVPSSWSRCTCRVGSMQQQHAVIMQL